jgi:iron complex outermembrane recepter protein
MRIQVQQLVLVTRVLPLLAVFPIGMLPAIAIEPSPETSSTEASAVPQLNEIEQPATTVDEWVTQLAQSSIVQITDVRLTSSPNGIEVVLETPEGAIAVPPASTIGDALIVDIPNARLALSSGEEFQAATPVTGIALVSVTNLPDDRVRVTITGTDAPPIVEIRAESTSLVLSVTTGAAAAPTAEEEAVRVVVTATRTEEDIADVPRSVTVITREEIEQQGAVTRDLQDILANTVPGYGPPSGRAFSDATALRGRNPLILIDGVPQTTNASSFFGRELRTIDPSAVERIEVVRGPSAIYGQGATGGVINIITRQASDERITSTVEVGVNAALGELEGESFGNYQEYGLSINEDAVDLLFNLSRDDAGASFDAEGDRIPTVQGTDESETFNLLGRIGWDIDDQQRLQFSANHYSTERDTNAISDPSIEQIPGLQKPQALVFDEGINFIDGSPQLDRNTVASLNYTHEDLFGSELQAQLYYRDNQVQSDVRDRRVRNQGIFQGVLDIENWGGRVQVETPFSEQFSLVWGADYANEQSTSSRNLFDPDIFDVTAGRVFQQIDEVVVVPSYDLDSFGVFAQAQWDVSEQIALSGGVRYERFDVSVDDYTTLFGDAIEGGSQSFDDIVFNLGALYRITNEISLFANFAQGFSVPNFSDVLFAPAAGFSFGEGFQDLEPQKINNYELGIRADWNDVQVSLAGFYNESDLGSAFIDIDGDNFFELLRAPEQIYGIEATLDWQPGGGWQLGGAISWVEGESDIPDDGRGYLAQSGLDIQPLKLTAYVAHETAQGWNNRLQALFVGSRDRAFEDDIDLAPVDSYVVLDFISSIRLGPGVLQLGIQNLLDNQYFPAYSQVLRVPEVGLESFATQASGRTVSVSYRVNF